MQDMRAHVQACAPLEACGILAGRDGAVSKVIPVANQAQSTVRFRMDPAEQLQAFNWMDANGLELAAIFHSHPSGPDRPSATDVAEAAYPAVYLIWSRGDADWQVGGYWIAGRRVSEVKLDIVDGE
jgi:[CysO sulfur-carrier protein]-S-L-cysteine hydrolase